MRMWSTILLVAALAAVACADCPPDCLPGGGSAATDCLVAFGGIASAREQCVDGTACDLDGVADGRCTFGLQACINVAGLSGCMPGPLTAVPTVKPTTSPTAQALATGLAALEPSAPGCTPPGVPLPLKISSKGIKAGRVRLVVSAASGGKRDTDRLTLECDANPTPPSFANDVQPIFTAKCAIPTCHSGAAPSNGQSLEAGQSFASNVNVPKANPGRGFRVVPGSIKKSYLAQKILFPRDRTSLMPQGCPGFPPAGGCLTDAEVFTILSWIANGAPDN
jgi:hypothetical protein